MNLAVLIATLAVSAPPTPVSQVVDNFTLDDFRGKSHSLSDLGDIDVVVLAFLGTECPLAKLYGPRLSALHEEFSPRGVAFLGVNANSQDSLAEIASYARRHQIGFPILKDAANRFADEVGARRTPEVFVLDKGRVVRYWGRIDDQFGVGYARDQPTSHELRNAIQDLLEGREVKEPCVESVGCYIGRVREVVSDATVTYSGHVARILQDHCVECHRDGEIAPFSLSEYDEVSGWAETILEVIEEGRMPPWHANPDHGSFVNARTISEEERRLIREWVEAGAPEGDPDKLPVSRDFVSGWRLGRLPDQTISMSPKPFTVPAEETVEYQYFVVDPGFTKDKWVSGAEVIPGNRAVVHHAIVFIRPPGEVRRESLGWLTAYVPGQSTTTLPAGQAILVPAGSKLVFQMHYTPIGTAQQDLTQVGLIFADPSSVQERVLTLVSLNRDFEIPPRVADHQVSSWFGSFPKNAKLLAMAPHMHLRGKSFRFVMHEGDQDRILLDVPNYDFNWQHAYQLSEPIPLREGMRVECIATFDNSEANLANPNPGEVVRWGDQTWEEMVVAYFGVSVPMDQPLDDVTRTQENERRRAQAKQSASRMMERFDANHDGFIERKEVPESFAVFAFGRFDKNGDGRITREEARRRAFQSSGSNGD